MITEYGRKVKAVRVALSAAILLFPVCGIAAPSTEVRAAARQVVDAYGSGDAATLHSLWSSAADAARRRFEIAFAQTLRVRCVELAGATIDSVSGGPGDVAVRATVLRAEWPRVANGPRRIVAKHLLMTFGARGDEWRLMGLSLQEARLADELMAHPEARETVLNRQAELVTDDLAESMYTAGMNSINAARPAQLETAALLAARVAELVDDRYSRTRAILLGMRMAESGGNVASQKELGQRALASAEMDGDADGQARALVALAGLDPAQSLSDYERALALEDRTEDRKTITEALGGIGTAKVRQNDHAAAMSSYLRAARIAEEIDDFASLVSSESSIASLLQRQNDYELSLVHLRRAYDLGVAHPGNRYVLAQVLINIGVSQSHLKQLDDAKDALKKALAIADESQSSLLQAQARVTLGDVYLQAGDYPAAIAELERGLAIAQAAKRGTLVATIFSELAVTKFEARDASGALAAADQCAATAQRQSMDVIYFGCRILAGKSHRILGHRDAAFAAFSDAISIIDDIRGAILGSPGQRANFLERARVPYSGAADFLAEQGDVRGSLVLAERYKARILLDALRTDHPAQPLTAAEQKREDESSARLTALNRQLRAEKSKPSPDPAVVAKLSAALTAARGEVDALQAELDAVHPRRMARQGATPLAEIDALAPVLGSKTAVIEYLVGQDHTRAFVITADGLHAHTETVSLPIGAEDLDRRVTSFADSLAQRSLDYVEGARALYASLLQPLEAALGGRKTLCIIPDGMLWRLPFEALIDRRGRFVVETRSTFYAPSLSVLAEATKPRHRAPAPETLLAVGNPTVGAATEMKIRRVYRSADFGPLREAEEEVRDLRSLYGARHSRLLVGAEATEGRVKSAMEKYRVLHFATHSILDEQNPLYSQVVFAQSGDPDEDGLLDASEIMELDLRADLAVLSSCETARGRVAAGEGIIGFTWALFVGGCPSSVVSQWKVDSASTHRLMVEFHRHLLAAKGAPRSTSDSLRAAKLALLRHSRWRHPFYWSAFVLVGSPQPPR